jgi:DNA-binding NarL/FixJ family response regulator
VPKSDDSAEIVTAIRSTAAGQAHLAEAFAVAVVHYQLPKLNPQEQRVLRLYTSGLSRKVVARRLDIGTKPRRAIWPRSGEVRRGGLPDRRLGLAHRAL